MERESLPTVKVRDLSSRGKVRASLEVCGEDLVGSPVIKMRSLYRFWSGCVTRLDGSAGPQCNYQLLNPIMFSFGLDATENAKFKKKTDSAPGQAS